MKFQKKPREHKIKVRLLQPLARSVMKESFREKVEVGKLAWGFRRGRRRNLTLKIPP